MNRERWLAVEEIYNYPQISKDVIYQCDTQADGWRIFQNTEVDTWIK